MFKSKSRLAALIGFMSAGRVSFGNSTAVDNPQMAARVCLDKRRHNYPDKANGQKPTGAAAAKRAAKKRRHLRARNKK